VWNSVVFGGQLECGCATPLYLAIWSGLGGLLELGLCWHDGKLTSKTTEVPQLAIACSEVVVVAGHPFTQGSARGPAGRHSRASEQVERQQSARWERRGRGNGLGPDTSPRTFFFSNPLACPDSGVPWPYLPHPIAGGPRRRPVYLLRYASLAWAWVLLTRRIA
jgi:hypothetical protein